MYSYYERRQLVVDLGLWLPQKATLPQIRAWREFSRQRWDLVPAFTYKRAHCRPARADT